MRLKYNGRICKIVDRNGRGLERLSFGNGGQWRRWKVLVQNTPACAAVYARAARARRKEARAWPVEDWNLSVYLGQARSVQSDPIYSSVHRTNEPKVGRWRLDVALETKLLLDNKIQQIISEPHIARSWTDIYIRRPFPIRIEAVATTVADMTGLLL